MPRFETSRRVRHAAVDMFNLVADVEKYPQFLPLCEALTVRGRKDEADGRTILVADMTVGYKVFRETFTSRVTLLPDEKRIQVQYLDGPFEHLDNRWTFTDNPDGTSSVGFYIDYAFAAARWRWSWARCLSARSINTPRRSKLAPTRSTGRSRFFEWRVFARISRARACTEP